jgi:hypothetical protein
MEWRQGDTLELLLAGVVENADLLNSLTASD